jgi:hypothetical protein
MLNKDEAAGITGLGHTIFLSILSAGSMKILIEEIKTFWQFHCPSQSDQSMLSFGFYLQT